MIEGKFENAIGAKAIGFSHGDFSLVVQTLDHATGNQFLSAEIVEDQFSVLAKRAGDFLHGLDTGAHSLSAPVVEELAGPGGRIVIPELLKGFLKKVSADSLEVVAKQIVEPEVLLVFEILAAFEYEPAGLL